MRAAGLWAPPLAWAACIFLLSSTANPSFRPPGPDTLLHIGGYAILAFFLYRALAGGLHSSFRPLLVGVAMGSAAAYGALDEVHQAFVPGRSSEVRDAVNGSIGAALGAASAAAVGAWRARRSSSPGPAAVSAGGALVTLYTREGCHLCDEALAVLEAERRERPFRLEVLDVDADPELVRQFGPEVPVVFVEGRKAFKFRIDPKQLRRRLERIPPGGLTT